MERHPAGFAPDTDQRSVFIFFHITFKVLAKIDIKSV